MVGLKRNVSSTIQAHRLKHGIKKEDCWFVHVEGACGECAVAKHLGIYWDLSVDKFKVPDVGFVHVRTTKHDNGRLIIRKDDLPGPYVLLTGMAPKLNLRGWFRSEDVREEMLTNFGNDREKVYGITQDKLYPINTLISSYKNS
jgi:hypothetical protein